MAEGVAPLVLPVRFQCPLCFDVLRDPIQLPCCKRHLCLVCFERSLELTSVFCGFCRRRIVGFARKKQNKVDQTLWRAIQERCAFLVRDVGSTTGEHQAEPLIEFIDEDRPSHERLGPQTTAGEVRQFYEQQLRKHQSERQHQDALALEQTMHFLQSDPEYVASLSTATKAPIAPASGVKVEEGAKQQRLDAFFGSPNNHREASTPSPSSVIPVLSLQKKRSSLPMHRISSSTQGLRAKRRKSWTPPTGLLQLKLPVSSVQKSSPLSGAQSKTSTGKRPWRCSQCTFENTCFDRRCSMCHALPASSENSQ